MSNGEQDLANILARSGSVIAQQPVGGTGLPPAGAPTPEIRPSLAQQQLQALSAGATNPAGSVQFARSPNPAMIRVGGVDVPRAELQQRAQGGDKTAAAALRLVPAASVAQPTAPGQPGATPGRRVPASPEAAGTGAQRGARPAMIIPGGFRPTARTTEMLKGITPGAREAMTARFGEGGSFHKETQAMQTELDYRAMMMDQAVKFEEKKAQIIEDRNLARQDLADRRKAATNEFMTDYQQTLEETNAMKIDDYWADKGTGTKILAAIAVGLGAAAREIRGGGQNTAMQIINQNIQRDLAVQKANLAKGRARLQDMQGGYALIRQKFDDEILADQIFYAGALEQVQGKIDTLMANAKTDDMLNAGQTLSAQRADQANQIIQEIMLRGELNVKTEEKFRDPKVVGGAQETSGAKYDPKRWITGMGRNARPGHFKELSEWMSDVSTVNDFYDQMIAYRDNWSNFTDAEKRTAIEEIAKATKRTRIKTNKMGASFTEGEEKMIDIPNPQAAHAILTGARLEQNKANNNTIFRNKMMHLTEKVNLATVPDYELEEFYRYQGQSTGAGGQERPVGGK